MGQERVICCDNSRWSFIYSQSSSGELILVVPVDYISSTKRYNIQFDLAKKHLQPNLGHFNGIAKQNTIIIPVLNRFENPHKTTVESGNNFVRLNDEGKTHLDEADLIAEVDFITELAHRLLGDVPVDWRRLKDTRYVRQLIAETVSGYEAIGQIDATKEEFTIGGRIFTTPQFQTSSSKAQMETTPLPTLTLPTPESFGKEKGIVLSLITGRAYRQHNTVVYNVEDKYRGMPHRHCILMNPEDVEEGSLRDHQQVTVQGEAGKLENIEIICGAIRRSAALMFFPEANVLMKGVTDPKSHTPAYKRVPVLIPA